MPIQDQRRKKEKRGDRRDGRWLREMDALHAFMPYLYPNRADNEAFIRESVDITALLAFLDELNAAGPDFKYTIFHAVVAAMVKTVTLRPQLNRFIQGGRIYQRHALTCAFVVKKRFAEAAHEALAFLYFDETSTLQSVHAAIRAEVTRFREHDTKDHSTGAMELVLKLPRPLLRLFMKLLFFLDARGLVPYGLVKADPNYASVFLTNLGSIKLNAAYHHLSNWGTNSLFVVVGEKHKAPVYGENGAVEMRDVLELGITLDERISDGYYYAKSIRLFKHLLENPRLLMRPAGEEVDDV